MVDGFTKFLSGLRSQNSTIRIRTARALRIHVESEARDLAPQVYTKCVHDLSNRILDMLHGQDSLDRIGGIVAMDELVDLLGADEKKIMSFAHSLAKILEKASNADVIMLKAATNALGHLVSTGGTTLIEFVEEYHMKPALVWLEKESHSLRHHAAVMILRELAVNAPSMFYRHIDHFFEVIWNPFHESTKSPIRESAAEALQACLALVRQRETNRKVGWYSRALDEVQRGLVKGTSDAMHGSLLIMNELLRNTGDFMYPHFDKVCKQVLQYKDHKHLAVKRAVINLLPRLAKFNAVLFMHHYLALCMNHLLEMTKYASGHGSTFAQSLGMIRGDAYMSIGKVALAIGSSAMSRSPHLIEAIMSAIREGLLMKEQLRKKDVDISKEALTCLRMMAEAVGSNISRVNMEEMVDIMFNSELNRALIVSLTTLAKRLPNQRAYIQVKLFGRITAILTGQNLAIQHQQLSTTSSSSSKPTFLSIFSSAADRVREKANSDPSSSSNDPLSFASTSMKILALDTLGHFDFQGNHHIPVMQFVHTVVVQFLDHQVAGIRKAAAITCCKLVLPLGEEAPMKGDIAGPISAVLERLLTVGIADTEADIRSKVLASLDYRFDPLLGLTSNLRTLFIALNDEIFEIRETAMSMLGRLSLRSPSYVMPALRQTLVQLLAELEYSGDARGKEESARLLGHLIRSAAHLARPFVLPILKALVKKLQDRSSSVSTSVMATLGELALVGSEELLPYLGELLPQILQVLRQYNSPQKLQVAIRTLGQLVSSTGYVIRPYFEYPDLLHLLCAVLQKSGDVNAPLRLETSRTLGILGALDPFSLKQFTSNKKGSQSQTRPIQQQLQLSPLNDDVHANSTALQAQYSHHPASENHHHHRPTTQNQLDMRKKEFMAKLVPTDELLPSAVDDPSQYFPAVVVNSLTRMLINPRNSSHYQGTILAMIYICKSLRQKVEPHLDKIIPSFLYSLDCVGPELREFLFEQLAALVCLVGDSVREHLGHIPIAEVVYKYWDSHLNSILTLMEEIARSLANGFKVYLPDLIPELLHVIRRERDDPERHDTQLVLRTIVSLGRLLDDYLHLVIPVLVKLIQSSADMKPRRKALAALRALIRELDVNEYASKIIHMLARVISSTSNELVSLAMDCLCSMVYTLGEEYAMFVPVLNQVLQKQHYQGDVFEKYDLLVSRVLKYQPLPMEDWERHHQIFLTVRNKKNEIVDEIEVLPINQQLLMKAWECAQRSTKDDWHEWMRAFAVELLRESPSPALRACKELASVYQPLAGELFNAAFVSVWPHLNGTTQDHLVHSLETAFQSLNIPSEILQSLLNLAEFMEHDDQPLPIDIRMLGALAEKCHSYAKALHYKELEFNTAPSSEGIDALISINNKLNQFEAAMGILKFAQEHLADVEVKASWHEKLHRWEDALAAHDRILEEQSSDDVDAIFGKMRCLYAVGQWRKLNDHVQSTWAKVYGNNTGHHRSSASVHSNDSGSDERSLAASLVVPPAMKKELCSHAARVALTLQNWDLIPKYINSDMDPAEAHLFSAVCSIRNMKLHDALRHIYLCRQVLDPTIRSLISESYSRAYMPGLIYLQNLVELEEIVQYTEIATNSLSSSVRLNTVQYNTQPTQMSLSSSSSTTTPTTTSTSEDALSRLRKVWTARMLGVEKNIIVWQHSLIIRSLVLDPKEDVGVWLKYSRLCRKSGHMNLALSALWRVGAQPFIRSIENNPSQPLPITLHGPEAFKPHPRVAFTYLKHLWADGREATACAQLGYLSQVMEQIEPVSMEDLEDHYFSSFNRRGSEDVEYHHAKNNATIGREMKEDLRNLRVQMYIKLSEWEIALSETRPRGITGGATTTSSSSTLNTLGLYDQVLVYLKKATNLDPVQYRVWHEWAMMNFRATGECASVVDDEQQHLDEKDDDMMQHYVTPAVHGFFHSILLGWKNSDVTKDVLRLLTLWFAHGHRLDVHSAMSSGFNKVSIDTWLDVIPQLIARIHTSNPRMNTLLHELLCRVGQAHPQALVYPITVASKSTAPGRNQAAKGILADVQRHSPQLVREAVLVSRELIRVAILWHELWYEALEEASRYYFNLHNPLAMIAELRPLHELVKRIGQDEEPTLREIAFYQAFARDLQIAQEWTNRYEVRCGAQNVEGKSDLLGHPSEDLNQAWDIYYAIFTKIRKQLGHLTTLELANVAPKLLSVQNLTLAIPGTYRSVSSSTSSTSSTPGFVTNTSSMFSNISTSRAHMTNVVQNPIVRIQSFAPKLVVLSSKQRPRKFTIRGSNGQLYPFLLKGHEDLRQDERVMQLFGLVNQLLLNDAETSRRNLGITRYSVLPLSHSSGLIGWVPNCDTLHQLIRDYREARKIQLNVEHRLMLQVAPDYEKCALMQKIEAFEYALGETTGQDLYKVLWLKSQNSEIWLDRRRNYTRSLAVMSMAGYILGLGDRHPSNLMLDRQSGKIVHIDFGDCFEVAMERDKFPEKIPFRLTRMLTQAMEVSGIEGNFRFICERVMRVLRDNQDSLLAVLEAFVHDPLITWRLLAANTTAPSPARQQRGKTSTEKEGKKKSGRTTMKTKKDDDVEEIESEDDEDDDQSIEGEESSSESSTTSSNVPPHRRKRHSSMYHSGVNYAIIRENEEEFLEPTNSKNVKHNASTSNAAKNGKNNINATEEEGDNANMPEELNEKAIQVIERVKSKLRGHDFDDGGQRQLSVEAQVDRLIHQATSHENLCQLYYGWCPFW